MKKKVAVNKKNLKILHIASFNQSSNGNLYYSTANKFNIGFTKLGHFVHTIDDKFFLKSNIGNTIYSLNEKIIKNVINFAPDLIILGHTNKINEATLKKIKILLPDVKNL